MIARYACYLPSDASTALPPNPCNIPLAAEPTSCCLATANQQFTALPTANPNLTIAAVPAVLLLISTATPAAITVYKVERRSLKYNLNASTVLLPNR